MQLHSSEFCKVIIEWEFYLENFYAESSDFSINLLLLSEHFTSRMLKKIGGSRQKNLAAQKHNQQLHFSI